MRESGWITREMVMENRSGLMSLGMRVTGLMIKLTVLENCSMQMVIFTRENGEMTKQMGEEPTLMPMEQSILAIGKMINSTVSVLKPGPTMPYTKASITKARKTEKEN